MDLMHKDESQDVRAVLALIGEPPLNPGVCLASRCVRMASASLARRSAVSFAALRNDLPMTRNYSALAYRIPYNETG